MSQDETSVTRPGEAAARFDQGFNCAQSVLAAFSAGVGLEESAALRLSSPFGGGISRRGQVCGAVSGALMALGLARGSDTPAGKEETYRITQTFLQRFEALHGSLTCRELTGHDISTPEGHQKAREAGVFKKLCPILVGDAARLLQQMLND